MTDGLHGLPVPALVDSDPKKNPFLANPQDPWHVDVRPSAPTDASRKDLNALLSLAAYDLALRRIRLVVSNSCPVYHCLDCKRECPFISDICHEASCCAGRFLDLYYAIAKLPEPASPRKQDAEVEEAGPAESTPPSRGPAWIGPNQVRWDMSAEYAERLKACVVFCEGIPTEDLKRELPLASPLRRRFHEIQHLRRALPWLPAVQL